MRASSRFIPACCATVFLIALLSGCRSAWIQAEVVNQQNTPVNLVEVDYPGGSFGTQAIAPHSTFHYRFHLLGSDQVTMTFTDASGQTVKKTGIELTKGTSGTLRIEIEPGDAVKWVPELTPAK
jgi:hypothetical protein